MKKLLMFLLVGIFMISLASADSLSEYYNGPGNENIPIWSNQRAQTFTVGTTGASSDQTVENISVLIYRLGTIPGTLQFNITETNSSGYPNSTIVGTGAIDVSALTTDTAGAWTNVTLDSSFTAYNTKTYGIVLNLTGSRDSSNHIKWKANSTGNYSGGSIFTGGVVVFPPTERNLLYDYAFRVWGDISAAVDIVTLETPTNDTTLSDVGINFTVSGNVTNSFNTTNITYYVWFTNGTIHNQTTIALSPTDAFNNTLFIDDFTLNGYIWNAEVCWENSSFNNCSFATDNFTFDVVPFSVLDEDWNNFTIGGSTDDFSINVSVLSGLRVATMMFTYNSTEYDADFTEYATEEYYASITHDILQVTADTNVSFYWTVTLENGFSQNSTLHNQTVQLLSFDDCSAGTFMVFNFTIVNEGNQTKLAGVGDNTNMLIDLTLSRLDASTLSINFSQNYTQVNPGAVCTNVNLNDSRFRVDGIVEYSATQRFVEFYNIQNYTLTNTTTNQNITLYNLNESLGQEFKITYKDDQFNTVPGAIIQIQRKYIDEGVFKTVEIPMVSEAGYTIAHLVRNDIIYNLVIIKEGTVLATFTNVVADCQNPTFTSCEINVNSFSTGIQPEDFSNDGEFTGVLSYNKTSRVVSTTFAILSGIPSLTTLNVTLWDALGETEVCSDSLTAAGGTLSCTVPASFGNSSIIIKLWSGGEVKRSAIVSLASDPSDIYGNNLVFLGLMIILLIIGMSVTDNPMTLGFMLIIGSIILVALNIVANAGWIGGGATMLWFIIAIIILMIKGSNRQ